MIDVAITDVCGFQGGTQPPKSVWSKTKEPGHIRMLQIRDFTQGKAKHIEYIADKKTLKKCTSDDILIGRYGASIGKILTGLAGAYNVAIVKTIPDKKKIDRGFLLHLLKGKEFQRFIQNVGSRAAQAGFNKQELTKFRFKLPPLPEQKKIAEILDAADSLRQKDQQLIEHYNTLSQSLFLDMFGDLTNNAKEFDVVTVGDVVSKVKDGPHVSPKYSEAGIPILSTRNIRPSKLVMDGVKYVSNEMYEELTKRFCPQKGDVLLTKGGTTGYAKIVDFDWKFCIWVHLAALRPKTKIINPKYLEASLNSHYCYQQSQLFTKGIANKDLGLKRMVNISLLLPPIGLQNEFVKRIQLIENQKILVEFNLKKSENLFNSLLQREFKGELTS